MSREIPYHPDPKPAAPSFEHMQSILDKHAQRLGVGQSPKSEVERGNGQNEQSTPGLVWSQPKKELGYVYIEAGPYRITRENKKYHCHRECYFLGTRDSGDAAKQVCEVDANGRQ
jgi:hypothetical protein